MQEPALRAGGDILAVAAAIEPVALSRLVLDPEIVPHRGQLGIAVPPLAEHPLGAVRPPHAAAMPRQVNQTGGWSGSRARVSIGSGRGSRRDGRGQCPGQTAPVSGAIAATRATERSGTSLATGTAR